MKVQYCGLCKKNHERLAYAQAVRLVTPNPSPPSTAVIPTASYPAARSTSPTEAGRSVFGDYAVVASRRAKDPNFLSHLSATVNFVHLDGHPFVWVLRKILEKMPQLKKLRVIPSMRAKMGVQHLTLLEERGVELITGHDRPDMAWGEGENRSATYRNQRHFMLTLPEPQKALFEELLRHGFDEAEIAARYFCMKGEGFIFQAEVGSLFGYSGCGVNTFIAKKIGSMLHYLDPVKFPAAFDAENRARCMKLQLENIRILMEEGNKLKEILVEMGIEKLPEHFSFAALPKLRAVHKSRLAGDLERLKRHDSREYDIVVQRYGIEDGVYRTLQTIGTLRGVTRERIRQIEERAFTFLGIDLE